MSLNEKDLNEFKSKNSDKIKIAANMAKAALGKDADKINTLLNDKEKLNKITASLSKNDLDKISSLLDNPAALKQLLSNDKMKENFKKIMGE